MQSTFWQKTKSGGKVGFDKLWQWTDKLGAPVNKFTNKLGSEAFWPTTLDKESDKAARILRSFCKDGFYEEEERPTLEGPTMKQKVLVSIPSKVIQNAKGLAIFTTMRTGLWMSGAGGCGIIVARLPDGSWSCPSGIMLHTAGLGFLVGIDIYDCVLVINTDQAMEAFARLRCTVGGEVSAVAGPVGTGALLETELHKRQAPIFTYMKSRGFYAGVQIDGTVMLERNDENERFYHEKLSAREILAGKVRHPPFELERLWATLKAAEGQVVDQNLVPSEPPPGDYEISSDGTMFGVPDKDDPDPYGVLQLEKEGMVIREAGTQKRASWEQFTFAPSPTSPVYDTFERKSKDRDSRSIMTASRRSSGLTSPSIAAVVNGTGEPSTRTRTKTVSSMTDMSTQTDDLPPPPSPSRNSTRSSTFSNQPRASMDHIPENTVAPPSPGASTFTSSRLSKHHRSRSSLSHSTTPPAASPSEEITQINGHTDALETVDLDTDAEAEDTADDHDDHDDSAIIEDTPVVQTIQKATVPQVIQKARMVTVPKRGPPPRLPPRNPNRSRGPLIIDAEEEGSDRASITSERNDLASPISPMSHTKMPTSYSSHANVEDSTGETKVLEDELTVETPEETGRDPWAHIMEQHSSNSSQDSVEVPGAFHSLPTTPDEVSSHAHVQKSRVDAKEEPEDFS